MKGAGLQRVQLPPENWFALPVTDAETLAERVLGFLANCLKCTPVLPVQIARRGFEWPGFVNLLFTGWPITEQAARIIVLNMFFKTPLAFAVVAAISASLMTLLFGVVALGVSRGLVHFAVLPSVSYLNMSSLGVIIVAVFSVTLPVETVYARRILFSKDQPSSAKPALLSFPAAVAVAICSRVIDWRQGSE